MARTKEERVILDRLSQMDKDQAFEQAYSEFKSLSQLVDDPNVRPGVARKVARKGRSLRQMQEPSEREAVLQRFRLDADVPRTRVAAQPPAAPSQQSGGRPQAQRRPQPTAQAESPDQFGSGEIGAGLNENLTASGKLPDEGTSIVGGIKGYVGRPGYMDVKLAQAIGGYLAEHGTRAGAMTGKSSDMAEMAFENILKSIPEKGMREAAPTRQVIANLVEQGALRPDDLNATTHAAMSLLRKEAGMLPLNMADMNLTQEEMKVYDEVVRILKARPGTPAFALRGSGQTLGRRVAETLTDNERFIVQTLIGQARQGAQFPIGADEAMDFKTKTQKIAGLAKGTLKAVPTAVLAPLRATRTAAGVAARPLAHLAKGITQPVRGSRFLAGAKAVTSLPAELIINHFIASNEAISTMQDIQNPELGVPLLRKQVELTGVPADLPPLELFEPGIATQEELDDPSRILFEQRDTRDYTPKLLPNNTFLRVMYQLQNMDPAEQDPSMYLNGLVEEGLVTPELAGLMAQMLDDYGGEDITMSDMRPENPTVYKGG